MVNISAVKIISEKLTVGSGPLLVLGDDGLEYYFKTASTNVPCCELINEVIGASLANAFGLLTATFAIGTIDKRVALEFEKEGKKLSKRYTESCFGPERLYFASRKISPSVPVEPYIHVPLAKKDFNYLRKPMDIVKIGALDLWIGNKDRRPENPNILLTEIDLHLEFVPIDHCAAFGYCIDYRQVSDTFLYLDENYRIFNTPIVRSISKYSDEKAKLRVKDEILNGIEVALTNLESIFDSVPREWGFSKKAKKHLSDVLSDQARNKKISEAYLGYIK